MKILITGGASGLGLAITKLLAKNQENTVYFTFNSSLKAAQEITNEYSNTVSIKCDFANVENLKSLSERIPEFDVDVLINNAYCGDIETKYFHKTTFDSFLSDFTNNVIPTIEITKSAIGHFRKKKNGKIITILTSYLANVPPVGLSTYLGNKAYLKQMTKVWASENSKFNITSNSVSPSFMETGLNENVDDRIVEQMKDSHPLKRLTTTDEVAETVAFLVNASSQINGVDLLMNAGTNIK